MLLNLQGRERTYTGTKTMPFSKRMAFTTGRKPQGRLGAKWGRQIQIKLNQ